MTGVIRFEPLGREAQVPQGTTILAAARGAGVPLGSSCDGEGACGWCRVTVLSGAEALSAIDEVERRLLERIRASGAERLACQARVRGATVVVTTTYW